MTPFQAYCAYLVSRFDDHQHLVDYHPWLREHKESWFYVLEHHSHNPLISVTIGHDEKVNVLVLIGTGKTSWTVQLEDPKSITVLDRAAKYVLDRLTGSIAIGHATHSGKMGIGFQTRSESSSLSLPAEVKND